jgi:hypothetical protein
MPRALGAVCFAIALLVQAHSDLLPAAAAQSPSRVARAAESIAPDAERPDYRLGDAAAPFGWSTVVADFDTDGRPDVAVADRLAPHGGSNEYRLEFSLAGQAPHDVTFESSQDAVTISVADVDRDNDLDVIVETPLSGQTVGIWLNDGHGHFTAGDIRELPETMRALHALETTAPLAHVVAVDSTLRSIDDALPAARQTIAPRPSRWSNVRHWNAFRSVLPLDRSTPRAPPALS